MDIFDKNKRSEVMARVRSKDTRPELRVRSYLHRRGLRFRLHKKELPGKPDIVFPSREITVFVHGCFWHGHEGCKKAKLPSTRVGFWRNKIQTNIGRDARVKSELECLGWRIFVVWECTLGDEDLNRLYEEIVNSN